MKSALQAENLVGAKMAGYREASRRPAVSVIWLSPFLSPLPTSFPFILSERVGWTGRSQKGTGGGGR